MMNILKKIIFFGAIGLVLFVAYTIFVKKDPQSTSLLGRQGNVNSGNILGADIIKAINEINSLELDRSVFDDPIFQTLVDRGQELTPKPTGRSNPFAPIGATEIAPAPEATEQAAEPSA